MTGAVRDLRLLSAAFGGDQQAVGSIYDEHGDSLYRLACFALGSSAEAQDVVVDVVVQACTAPGLLVGRAGEDGLRLALARRTFERCRQRRPAGARAPVGAVVAVCLSVGCSGPGMALVLGVAPGDVRPLLTRDLQALAASPTPS